MAVSNGVWLDGEDDLWGGGVFRMGIGDCLDGGGVDAAGGEDCLILGRSS